MSKDLSDYRKNYQKDTLLESDIPQAPMALFEQWFKEAEQTDHHTETNAMNISSIGFDGFPKNRIVLLKQFNSDGFIFFTNYQSEKGLAFEQNNKVCCSFFWEALEKQVIVKGIIEKTSEEISNLYFKSRPIGSQIGALASPQSQVIENRAVLDENLEALKEKYQQENIKRPEHWGGYMIKPVSIEFWQGRPNRMHDRIRYTNIEKNIWKIERLAP